MSLWQKTKDFWVRSYTSDRRAFYYETIASACVFISMTWIAVAQPGPDFRYIYPVSFLGAVFSILAFIRRGAGWRVVMTKYFAFVHVTAWLVAMEFF